MCVCVCVCVSFLQIYSIQAEWPLGMTFVTGKVSSVMIMIMIMMMMMLSARVLRECGQVLNSRFTSR